MKKIGIFVPGGVGDKDCAKTNPPLEEFIARISRNFDVTVYSLISVERDKVPSMDLNFNVRSINANRIDSLVKRVFLLSKLFLRDHKREKYQIIHGIWAFPAGFMTLLLGKITRLPVIVSLQGGEAAYVPQIAYGNMYNRLLKVITLWTCRHADVLTALTEFQSSEIKRFGLRRKDVHVIPYGVDRTVFKPLMRTFAPPFHFLHVANLNKVKDELTLLRAFALISKRVDCRLRIVGPDHLDGQLQRFIDDSETRNNVELLGHVPHKDLPFHYGWAHVMLHTSYYEGQAVVVAEAAASGVVVCGTRVGLIADLDQNCAVSVAPGDYENLAREALSLLNDRERFETIRLSALNWASTYDADWTASQFTCLYDQVSVDRRPEKSV